MILKYLLDTMHFLGQYSNGSGNYTNERGLMFDHLELDDIFAELKKVKE